MPYNKEKSVRPDAALPAGRNSGVHCRFSFQYVHSGSWRSLQDNLEELYHFRNKKAITGHNCPEVKEMTDAQIRKQFDGAGDFIARELDCGNYTLYAYA